MKFTTPKWTTSFLRTQTVIKKEGERINDLRSAPCQGFSLHCESELEKSNCFNKNSSPETVLNVNFLKTSGHLLAEKHVQLSEVLSPDR